MEQNTEQNTEIAAVEVVQLGTLEVCGPVDVIRTATEMASTLANVIERQKLFTTISGRRYVRVEGWTTLGAMLGILPREVGVQERENGDFEATVELIRASDGAIVGRASSIVSSDEKLWASRPRYARRSMAVTRATGKAYRLGFSWVMTLAGYEPTPAEEMPQDNAQDQAIEGHYREITPEAAAKLITSAGERYGHLTTERLKKIRDRLGRELAADTLPSEYARNDAAYRLQAAEVLLEQRNG